MTRRYHKHLGEGRIRALRSVHIYVDVELHTGMAIIADAREKSLSPWS